MTKVEAERVVDLDALSPPATDVKVGGVQYRVKEPNMIEFLEIQRINAESGINDFVPGSGPPSEDMVRGSMEQIKLMVPTMPQEVVEGLSPRQSVRLQQVLSEFIRLAEAEQDLMPGEAEEAQDGKEDKDGPLEK